MTNLTGYYSDNGGSRYSTTRSKTYSTTLSETQTWTAKIKDSTGEESEVVTEEIHIMADDYQLQSNYRVVGNIYPTLVEGSTSTSYLYGTDVYWAPSPGYYYIQSAAVHMGLVKNGEERLLKIKIVECPEGGYVGSTRNGIASSSASYSSSSSYYGFVFIGDNGEELKAPSIEISTNSKKDSITVQINAQAYNGATIEKYFYSIDGGSYIESTQSSYTFTGLTEYTEYTIKAYAVDSNNTLTSIIEKKTIAGDFPEGLTVIKDPGNLTSYRGNNDQVLGVIVTGSNSGNLWGTEIYTDDSTLSKAVVHMGLAKVNQTVLVKIQILPGQTSYTGSTQYGITSNDYGSYAGSYKILDRGPTIESVTQVPEEGQATIGIEATAYNDKKIAKYYYKLNDGEYIESDVATYTFTGLEPYQNNTITVYVKDTDNLTSEEKTITVRVTGKVTLSGYPVIYNNEYGFINEEDTVVPNNGGVQSSTANSYIEIDLSNYSADSTYTISIEAEVSSENNYDYGYATITTQTTAPSYDSTDGRFVYICGTVANKEYTSDPLVGGQKYYLHLGYRKDGSRDTGNDKVIFKNLKIQ